MADRRRRPRAAKTPTKKRCARCLQTKPLDDFGENPRMKLGRKSYCKDCSADLQRQWREERAKAKARRRRK